MSITKTNQGDTNARINKVSENNDVPIWKQFWSDKEQIDE